MSRMYCQLINIEDPLSLNMCPRPSNALIGLAVFLGTHLSAKYGYLLQIFMIAPMQ